MGERNQTQTKTDDGMDDLYDPSLSEFGDDDFDALEDNMVSLREDSLATKRRRAEQRLEALRLREELGDYDFDFDFDDDF
jgi:hypothetical protein